VNLILLAHFSKKGDIDDQWYSFALSKALSGSKIVLCTTNINQRSFDRASIVFDEIILVPNIGYDFYSWHKGLIQHVYDSLSRYEYIILINTSIRITNLNKFLNSWIFPNKDKNVTCFSLSKEISLHAQSYFLIIPFDVLFIDSVKFFWVYMKPLSKRQEVIYSYEIGLSLCFLEASVELSEIIQLTFYEKIKIYLNFIFKLGFLDNLRGLWDVDQINKVLYVPNMYHRKYGFVKLKLQTPLSRLLSRG
jgi:lipopolysaccharide biosynthesis protein